MIDLIDGKLAIFERFQIDHSLPKHVKKKVGDRLANQKAMSVTPNYDVEEGDTDSSEEDSSLLVWRGDVYTKTPPRDRPSLLKRCVGRLRWGLRYPLPTLPPTETMRLVFQNAEQLKTFQVKQDIISRLIENAKRNGQTALFEDLTTKQAVLTLEAALITLGYIRFVSEEVLVQTIHVSSKAFRLDYLRNFVRFIPDGVSQKKQILDQALIFDNYVVLHYDPSGRSNKLTAAEVRARNDPILFGLIKGSRRLYLVGDWVDTTCTLTFEELLKEIDRVGLKPGDTTLSEVAPPQ